jgi:CO dehydrogenase/acetyl-CoA synthase gamma subunit (corrinoid Fe-S protein)
MNEEEFPFTIPEQLVSKIYDLSGDSDKYKGVILAVASEDGSPMIYSKFDSTVMELGLRKALEDWVKGTTEMQGLTDDL